MIGNIKRIWKVVENEAFAHNEQMLDFSQPFQ